MLSTLVLASSVVCVQAEGAGTLRVSTGSSTSPVAEFARKDMNTYLTKLFTNPVDMSGTGESFNIVTGTTESNPLIKQAVESGSLLLPDGKNADQGYSIKTLEGTVYIAGNTDQGVLYGIYEFLEQYGAYFQITGEVLPKKTRFKAKKFDIRESPVFKYRGILPWANFLCGISGYNQEDYDMLVDRLTRMKFNMLQLEFYSGISFFTEEYDGKSIYPTSIGVPVDTFKTKDAVGELAFKGEEIFGPDGYVKNIGNPKAQSEAMQGVIRQVIDHAHERGWKTCIGFELMHQMGGDFTFTDRTDGWNTVNPLDPHNADLSVQRYRTFVKTYPNSDFYWMWQSEGHGYYARSVGSEPGAAEMRQKNAHWAESSPVWGDTVLSGDIDYAYLFREVANRLTPEERSKLSTGGWSIEHLFPNIDAEFPDELIFASLNAFDPEKALNHEISSFRTAKSGRRTWMIDWWEYDGSLWFTQFRAEWQERMYRKCEDYGVECVSLLGWKISGIEHNVRYLADYSWNPKLTADAFYKDYVSKMYGSNAGEVADIFSIYDSMDPKMPPATPGFAAPMHLGIGIFALKIPPVPVNADGLKDQQWQSMVSIAKNMILEQKNLLQIDIKSVDTIKSLMPGMNSQGKYWAKLLTNRLEFRVLYVKAMIALNQALIAFNDKGQKSGIAEARKASAKHVEKSVDLTEKAIEKYAEVVLNRGDLGVIAQLNEQHLSIIKRYLMTLGGVKSQYAVLDDSRLMVNPVIGFDFAKNPFPLRDGKVDTSVYKDGDDSILSMKFGGDSIKDSSVYIYSGTLDLDKTPYLDFMIKTSSVEPLAIMFRVENDPNWHALNLLGVHGDYKFADGIPVGSFDDGKWHRVTWNLRKFMAEKFPDSDMKISNIILGAWEKPSQPISVEFKEFSFGALGGTQP
ncbi:MAG: alpha-glucuronidase family glycosyl hydrolase [Armatimonadota bacterium]